MIQEITDKPNTFLLGYGLKGGKKLTSEEKSELQKKYDIKDMTPGDEIDLLQDLEHDGVVSGDDFIQALSEYVGASFKSKQVDNGPPQCYIDTSVYSKKFNWVNYYSSDYNNSTNSAEKAFDSRVGNILSELA